MGVRKSNGGSNETHQFKLALAVTGGLIISSCSPGEAIAEQIIEGQAGIDDVEIDEEDGTFKIEIEDEEGDLSAVIGGGDLQDGFPIPVAEGGEVTAVVEQAANTTVSLSYDSSRSDEIKDFYEAWVAGNSAELWFRCLLCRPARGGDFQRTHPTNHRWRSCSLTTPIREQRPSRLARRSWPGCGLNRADVGIGPPDRTIRMTMYSG